MALKFTAITLHKKSTSLVVRDFPIGRHSSVITIRIMEAAALFVFSAKNYKKKFYVSWVADRCAALCRKRKPEEICKISWLTACETFLMVITCHLWTMWNVLFSLHIYLFAIKRTKVKTESQPFPTMASFMFKIFPCSDSYLIRIDENYLLFILMSQ